MSKKHFIALADAVRPLNLNPEQLSGLADFCSQQNPLFKRDRWLGYVAGTCGKNGGSK